MWYIMTYLLTFITEYGVDPVHLFFEFEFKKLVALFFCFLRGFWGRISSCGCLGLCTGQPQIPCCIQSTDATAKKGGIPGVILQRIWRHWTRSGYPIVRVTSRCVLTTLQLGRDDRGKENAVSPP